MWKSVEKAQMKLKDGYTAMTARDGEYFVSYFLWFEDPMVSEVKLMSLLQCLDFFFFFFLPGKPTCCEGTFQRLLKHHSRNSFWELLQVRVSSFFHLLIMIDKSFKLHYSLCILLCRGSWDEGLIYMRIPGCFPGLIPSLIPLSSPQAFGARLFPGQLLSLAAHSLLRTALRSCRPGALATRVQPLSAVGRHVVGDLRRSAHPIQPPVKPPQATSISPWSQTSR